MTTPTQLPLIDTSDMIGLHNIFREALSHAPTLVGTTPVDDTTRAELVGSYYDNVLRLLHAHHEGEDELMTPLLAARCEPGEVTDVERIAAQHESMLRDLQVTEECLAVWRRTPAAQQRDHLLAAAAALQTSLTAHLGEEELVILPIAARHLTAAEWAQLPQHGMATFTGDKPWLMMGLVRDQMSPTQAQHMDTSMPAPVAAMWRASGQPTYTSYLTALHTTS